ncbi:cell wall-binding repeat-containing protein [Proteinivorax tanatarense]|uniref:Cell wall-binding repeat-containing protein n=1 Tax=Proteinivorax tanatarense TaxID=1260629 RepID=A0AAU7VHS0_9FIRM
MRKARKFFALMLAIVMVFSFSLPTLAHDNEEKSYIEANKNNFSIENAPDEKIVTEDAAEEDAAEEDATEEDATEEDATEEDATEEDATEEDATEEDATEEDATEEDATEEDAAEEDATEEGATEEDATEEDATEEDATEEDATEEDATEEDAIEKEEQVISDYSFPSTTNQYNEIVAFSDFEESEFRISGPCRYTTAVEVSKEGWPLGADIAVLASGEDFPDALAGAPLAYQMNAPILLTGKDSLHDATKQELKRLGVNHIYILGGENAVSSTVDKQLKSLGYQVTILSGRDRYETAIEIGNELRKENQEDTIILATGNNYPDALSIAPVAAKKSVPILFTPKDHLRDTTNEAIAKWDVKNVVIVGGENAVSKSVVTQLENEGVTINRISGADRYETSLEIAKEFDTGYYNGVVVATGEDFPDALASSVLAAQTGKPILLARQNQINSNILSYIFEVQGTPFIIGGNNAISEAVAEEVINVISKQHNFFHYSYYNLTMEQALDLQKNHGGNVSYYDFNKPASMEEIKKYLNTNNFIPFEKDYKKTINDTLTVNTDILNVRERPNTNSPRVARVRRNENYTITDKTFANDGYIWYEIHGADINGWVRGDLVVVPPIKSNPYILETIKVTASVLNVRKAPTTDSDIIDRVSRNEVFVVEQIQNGWYKITTDEVTGWVSGGHVKSTKEVPREMFQFLVLSGSSGTNSNDLNRILENKGTLHNTGKAFIEAGKKHNINEIYIVAHALHETGNGSSKLAQGVIVGKKDGELYTEKEVDDIEMLEDTVKVYNMYGIRAFDRDPINEGAKYAYRQGWDTPEKAVIGGAEWISLRYVNHPIRRQDTLYKMKWNPASPARHQYATDVGWSVKQISFIKNLYDQIDNYQLRFDIPVYYRD